MRLANSDIDLKTFVWKNGAWREDQFVKKCGWILDGGFYIMAKVPDTKSKIQMYSAFHRQIRLPGRSITLPARTNLVIDTELPPSHEIQISIP
jgi:hypothetical protein